MTTLLNKIKTNKFISYVFFAIITTIINVSVYLIFYNLILSNIIISNIIAYVVSISVSFIINKKVVFRNNNSAVILQIVLYLGVKLISFGIDSVVLIVLHDYLKVDNFIAKIIANASTTLSNYTLNNKVVFKK